MLQRAGDNHVVMSHPFSAATPSMQAQGDNDQGCAENADSRPAGEFPSEARARAADPAAHKHSAHKEGVQPVIRFWAKHINDVLVSDQRTLLAEVQRNDANDQADDRTPRNKYRPGRGEDDAAKPDDGLGTSPVCDLPGDRRKKHADRTGDAKQARDFGAEVVSGVGLQCQDSDL
jgi:hypothetical protein